MLPSSQRSHLNIARAIEATVEGHDAVVGLDRSGVERTVGPGATVRGVRVERMPEGDVVARLEVVGFAGTVLPDAGEQLRLAICDEFDRLGLDGLAFVRFTDVLDAQTHAGDS